METHDIRHPDVTGWGVDAQAQPGIPMEAAPHPIGGAWWNEPVKQPPTVRVPMHVDRDRPTPVFGTAQPFNGLSGLIRRAAYGIPPHRASHWMLLMLGDRVDVVESRPVLLLGVAVVLFGGLAWRALRRNSAFA